MVNVCQFPCRTNCNFSVIDIDYVGLAIPKLYDIYFYQDKNVIMKRIIRLEQTEKQLTNFNKFYHIIWQTSFIWIIIITSYLISNLLLSPIYFIPYLLIFISFFFNIHFSFFIINYQLIKDQVWQNWVFTPHILLQLFFSKEWNIKK